MSSFDPSTVRQAVAAFTPRRPQKFHDLSPAREVIAELRQKRASYRAIAELLTVHCLPISKTAVAVFCHEVLGEIVRPKRRSNRPPKASNVPAKTDRAIPALPSTVSVPGDNDANSEAKEVDPLPRSRGPRIAQVRILNPKSV